MSDDELLDLVSGSESDDGLNRLSRKESAVTSDDERLAGRSSGDGRQGGLDEVLGVVLQDANSGGGEEGGPRSVPCSEITRDSSNRCGRAEVRGRERRRL